MNLVREAHSPRPIPFGVLLGRNEFGTPVSVHRCPTCGNPFTVCPPASECPERFGPYCLAIECASYNPARDATVFFTPDDPELIEGNR